MNRWGEPDIVERLQAASVKDRMVIEDAGIMQAAADEIEELREAIRDAFGIMDGEIDGNQSYKGLLPDGGWGDCLREAARAWHGDTEKVRADTERLLAEVERRRRSGPSRK